MQRLKSGRLARSRITPPNNLTFVPIDFEATSLHQALGTTAFAFDRPAFCSWLGVTQYLTASAIEATHAFMLLLPRGSEIVFSVTLPQEALSGIEADAVAIAAAKSAEVGEPWLSSLHPTDIAAQQRRMGFSKVINLTPEEVHERYLIPSLGKEDSQGDSRLG
jgi:O-methyltransferase involved in polyketide biosynthesis